MTENHPEAIPLRSRTVLHLHVQGGGTQIDVDHVYAPEGAFDCEDCDGAGHDPGMVGLTMSGDDRMYASGLLTAEEALLLANRLTRAASLVLESEEDVPDVEREAARFSGPPEAPAGSLKAGSLKAGDVIAVPAEIIAVTGFRETSRLVIRQRKASQRERECKSCGAAIAPGDLYAASSEPTSDRCIRCVDGWPLAPPESPLP